jgi:hypothetical protein
MSHFFLKTVCSPCFCILLLIWSNKLIKWCSETIAFTDWRKIRDEKGKLERGDWQTIPKTVIHDKEIDTDLIYGQFPFFRQVLPFQSFTEDRAQKAVAFLSPTYLTQKTVRFLRVILSLWYFSAKSDFSEFREGWFLWQDWYGFCTTKYEHQIRNHAILMLVFVTLYENPRISTKP